MSDSSTRSTHEDDPEEALPRCRCGTDARSKYAVIDREYSFFGTLYLLWGGTAIPSRISFRCVKCGDMFESTTSPWVCRQYIK